MITKCRWRIKRQRPTQVQQESTATLPTDIDLIRPVQAFELRQRPRSTSVQLVHTEEVVWVRGTATMQTVIIGGEVRCNSLATSRVLAG
jgi:hypothetical protein